MTTAQVHVPFPSWCSSAISPRIASSSVSLRSTSWPHGPGSSCLWASVKAKSVRSTYDSSRLVRVGAALTSHTVQEVNIKTYDAAVEAAGDKLVVLDMYTQWCGPCKLIAPKLEALAQQYKDVVFLKLDCNEENKPLAKSLGVRVVPTFKLIRNKKVILQIEGAKYDEILDAIIKNHIGASLPKAQVPGAPILKDGQVVEVGNDTFYQALQEAGNRLVVLDMYTDWCEPCKILAPKFSELAAANADIVFLKLNCNEENKPLAKGLGVVAVPTVKLFKFREFVDEVRGLKYDLILEKVFRNR